MRSWLWPQACWRPGRWRKTAAFSTASETVTVPAELFGGDPVELELGVNKAFEPKAKLIMEEGGMLAPTTKFSVTYTLSTVRRSTKRCRTTTSCGASLGPDAGGGRVGAIDRFGGM